MNTIYISRSIEGGGGGWQIFRVVEWRLPRFLEQPVFCSKCGLTTLLVPIGKTRDEDPKLFFRGSGSAVKDFGFGSGSDLNSRWGKIYLYIR